MIVEYIRNNTEVQIFFPEKWKVPEELLGEGSLEIRIQKLLTRVYDEGFLGVLQERMAGGGAAAEGASPSAIRIDHGTRHFTLIHSSNQVIALLQVPLGIGNNKKFRLGFMKRLDQPGELLPVACSRLRHKIPKDIGHYLSPADWEKCKSENPEPFSPETFRKYASYDTAEFPWEGFAPLKNMDLVFEQQVSGDKVAARCPQLISMVGDPVIYPKTGQKVGSHFLACYPLALRNLLLLPLDELTLQERSAYAKRMLDHVTALHEQGFAHRDIKLENFLETIDEEIKLADTDTMIAADTYEDHGEAFGTESYMPPEWRKGEIRDILKVDAWSVGCSILELLAKERAFQILDTSKHPNLFSSEEALQKRVRSFLAEVPEERQEVVLGLLRLNPEMRLSVADATRRWS